MLEIKDLCVSYGQKEILHNVNLSVNKGEIITLVGRNGCGKSTLLKTVAGILKKSKGNIIADTKNIDTLTQEEIAKKVAYLSQGKDLPEISVKKMVLHGRFPYLSYPRHYTEKDVKKAEIAMEKMGISHLCDMQLKELSGGMRQKVYIAMALCKESEIFAFDEPCTYLDIKEQMNFAKILNELANEGKYVISVSHDLLSALQISQKIAVMDKGKIITCDTPEKIAKSYVIQKIFGVNINTVSVNGKKQYFYS